MIVLVGGPLDGKTADANISAAFVWFDENLRSFSRQSSVRLPSGKVVGRRDRTLYRFEFSVKTVEGVKYTFLYAGHAYAYCCGEYHKVGAEVRKCPKCEAKLCPVM